MALFATRCRLIEFTGQILAVLDTIAREIGSEKYAARVPGSGGFPTARHATLRSLQRAARAGP
jgi:hypothetical protein